MRRLEVYTPSQTSVGGQVFFEGLIGALAEETDNLEGLFVSSHILADNLRLPECSEAIGTNAVSLHLGASVSKVTDTTVFWPLSVAPVEDMQVELFGGGLSGRLRPPLMRLKLREAMRRSDHVIFSSEYTKSRYQNRFHSLAAKPIDVINTGHSLNPPASFLPKARPSIDGTFKLLWVGNAYPYKGLLPAIEGVRMASKSSERPLQLDVVGTLYDNEESEAARALSRDMPDLIKLHGSRSPEGLQSFYSSADAFLFTSRTENYGSFALADAFKYGLPTISSNRSSSPEMAECSSIEIDTDDPSQIAAAIEDLVSSEKTYRKYAQLSAERGQRLPTWNDVAVRLLASISRYR